ncbi:TRAP transporter substrate-binding protein [Treponema sp.]|uniref:TRAP transporter substrate-binding protein n=1 Tax=Treponema sp. TaxID=166 RepID=UPI0025FD9DCC|nr:TRAP transporter substrate-binding protein [Treponema sp.]MCR5218129.1 TRAP transporter substrate-binding protein [Treponema sp.]
MKDTILYKIFTAALILVNLSFFTGCDKKNNKLKHQITLVMAEVNSEDSICGQMDYVFKQKVEELSQNEIIINIKYDGVLGNEQKVINFLMTKDSFIHLARVGANLSDYGADKSGLLSIPYTFSSREGFWNFADSPVAQLLLNESYDKGLGIKGLFYAEEGFRNFISTVPLYSPQSLKGKNMRVSGKSLTNLSAAFETKAVQVSFSRMAKAFSSGEIQIAEQPLTNYYSNDLYISAPYVILDKHLIGAVQTIISASCWDSLSQKEQDILMEAGKYAQEYCRHLDKDMESMTLEKLKEKGVVVTQVKNPDQWKDKCSNLIKEASSGHPELYKLILEYQK